MDKQQFLARKNISTLPRKEQLKRWQQHQQSVRMNKPNTKRNRQATRLVRKSKPTGDVLKRTFSPCALDYLMALEAPFSLKQPACVPDLHSIPSKKVRVKTKGTFSTGVNGVGFIQCANWANSNGAQAVLATNAAYAGGETFQASTFANVDNFAQFKMPYANTQFEGLGGLTGVQARTVGTGLRIRYIGPELSRSGQITAFRHPDNETLIGSSFTAIRSYETAKTYSVQRKWVYLMYRPTKPDEYHFSRNASTTDRFIPPTTSYPADYEMGFAITDTSTSSGTPGPGKFEWQHIRFVEFIGNIDNISRSHTDLVGMSHIRNQMPEKSTTDNPMKHVASIVKKIEDHVGESLPAAGAGALAYKTLGSTAVEEEAAGGAFASVMAAAADFAGPALESALPLMETLSPLLLIP